MLDRLRPAFWICLALFVLHQLLQKGMGMDVPFIHAYLDPTMSIPLMLGVLNIERNWLFGRTRLTGLETVIGTVFLAFVFEVLFPRWSDAFTYDPWDFVAYGLGGLIFWLFVNPRG